MKIIHYIVFRSGSFVGLIFNVCAITHSHIHTHTHTHSRSSLFSYFQNFFWSPVHYLLYINPSFIPSSIISLIITFTCSTPFYPSTLSAHPPTLISLSSFFKLILSNFHVIFQISHFVLKILRFLFLMLHWEDDVSVIEVRTCSFMYAIS